MPKRVGTKLLPICSRSIWEILGRCDHLQVGCSPDTYTGPFVHMAITVFELKILMFVSDLWICWDRSESNQTLYFPPVLCLPRQHWPSCLSSPSLTLFILSRPSAWAYWEPSRPTSHSYRSGLLYQLVPPLGLNLLSQPPLTGHSALVKQPVAACVWLHLPWAYAILSKCQSALSISVSLKSLLKI